MNRADIDMPVADTGAAAMIKLFGLTVIILPFVLCILAPAVSAQDDALKLVETKRIELKDKEEQLKREEERLNALRKDVDEQIAAYTRLLDRVESALRKVEQARNEQLENIVKAYEVMAAENAAARLSALDNQTALQILTHMKSKKAGAIIAAMAPGKAASLTRGIAAFAVRGGQP